MLLTLSHNLATSKLYHRIKNYSSPKIILSWICNIRYCTVPKIQYPFKPNSKVEQSNIDDPLQFTRPICITLPKQKSHNGDVTYTDEENKLASVTTILKNSMSYGDYIRIQKWKQKAQLQLGHLEYHKTSTTTNVSVDEEEKVATAKLDKLKDKEYGGSNWAELVEQTHLLTTTRLDVLENEMGEQGLPAELTPEQEKLVQSLGKNELRKYVDLIRKRGHSLHELIRDYLSDKELIDYFKTTEYWHSVSHVLDEVTQVHALESCVWHSNLGYAGTVDAVAQFRGETCVFDWKTSKNPKLSIFDCYDYPYQAVAYAGAINQDFNYPFQVDSVAIVIVYNDGQPATVIRITADDCQLIWEHWLIRLQMYKLNCQLKQLSNDRVNYFSDNYWHRKALKENKIEIKVMDLSGSGDRVQETNSSSQLLSEIRILQGKLDENKAKIKERFRVSKPRRRPKLQ
ncbi:uncharacterized protein TRIADDRAFT_56767 [Trichoplax adhaerens]|uniref:Mitochondrial genome maintenance exonuclease 1 n=1 Tax=Trichoplax adhaerens TaxID=10228 RepID=B3RWJ1_TRIAD|nr:hypothetical protein TRIADDRAFT_56767 [Trichoplax adhaerens]EDV25144.1 hypothetical protein TRIADDRAFT_56767 [Trichoplax adhaerens]|eukprot:XP_002113034.1 hypothetical protein TRIADDRAFT_56767 [Trichoplax adhaerens]